MHWIRTLCCQSCDRPTAFEHAPGLPWDMQAHSALHACSCLGRVSYMCEWVVRSFWGISTRAHKCIWLKLRCAVDARGDAAMLSNWVAVVCTYARILRALPLHCMLCARPLGWAFHRLDREGFPRRHPQRAAAQGITKCECSSLDYRCAGLCNQLRL